MPAALDLSRIRVVSLDLDDTLWPVAPTIAGAEAALRDWLVEHAPATAVQALRRAFLAAGDALATWVKAAPYALG